MNNYDSKLNIIIFNSFLKNVKTLIRHKNPHNTQSVYLLFFAIWNNNSSALVQKKPSAEYSQRCYEILFGAWKGYMWCDVGLCA